MCNIMRPIACGINVRKKKLACAIVIANNIQDTPEYHHRKVSIHNLNLLNVTDWILSFDCHCVCLESIGKYWIPVSNYLEERNFDFVITHSNMSNFQKVRRLNRRTEKFKLYIRLATTSRYGI